MWGSVNYGQSLYGLHNTKSLRTPALANNQKKVEKENEFTGKRYKNRKNNNILTPKHKLSRDQGGGGSPFQLRHCKRRISYGSWSIACFIKEITKTFCFYAHVKDKINFLIGDGFDAFTPKQEKRREQSRRKKSVHTPHLCTISLESLPSEPSTTSFGIRLHLSEM